VCDYFLEKHQVRNWQTGFKVCACNFNLYRYAQIIHSLTSLEAASNSVFDGIAARVETTRACMHSINARVAVVNAKIASLAVRLRGASCEAVVVKTHKRWLESAWFQPLKL
jgi:hypothetical protein